MGAPTEYYVDPAINGNSGTGTIGDPFGDLQYALNTVTRNSTDGDRFNVKAGTAESITTDISVSTYGNGTVAAPLIIEGYTSSAGDGGIGEINGGGTSAYIFNGGSCVVIFRNMKIGNVTTDVIGTAATGSRFLFCEIHTATFDGTSSTSDLEIIGCYFHDIGRYSCYCGFYAKVMGNYIDVTGGVIGIYLTVARCLVDRNIITGNPSSSAILLSSQSTISNNSILASGSTVDGISDGGSEKTNLLVVNNLVEGFSGSGGVGINLAATTNKSTIDYNAAYNNATNYSLGDTFYTANNEALGASPFAKSGSDTFANRYTYFSPVDTGNVQGGALQ